MERNKIEEYDLLKLEDAKHLITEVYEYYYGYSPMKKEVKRLETIISKLDYLIQKNI